MTYENNPQLELAFNFIHYTNQHIFLTGKAGTGKTTFLRNLKKVSPKRMVVVAPTGVAAINAGGVTIHSFFQLPFGPQIPQNVVKANQEHQGEAEHAAIINRFSRNKINLIRSLDLLVIDEISMVRADVLDAIDTTLRRFKNRYLPFGGVQLLMIGDLQQLAPVIKDEEWQILGKYYETGFFFSSHALRKSEFIGIELKHIYRQKEQEFIDLLNKVRENNLNQYDLQQLNHRYIPHFSPPEEEGYITLTTHNYQAANINDAFLRKLSGKTKSFTCQVKGEFPEYSYPADEVLEVKTGAQVMFLKNDISPEKRYFNGKIGKIQKITEEIIEVLCPGETEPIIVEPATWDNTRYNLNEDNGEIEEKVIGQFIQYPLRLAWAITIHKSQGLTFEKAVIDARQSFAHGQVYVALSRCKSLEGLVLSTPLLPKSLIRDDTVLGFTSEVEQNQPDENALFRYRKSYELQLLNELFNFKPFTLTISYLLKTEEESASSIIGNLFTELKNIQPLIREELVNVADKFKLQVEKLSSLNENAENNPALQERLQKAAGYFLSKLEEHVEKPLEKLTYESDNKAVLKKIGEMLTRLDKETVIKRGCLESVQKGFSIRHYLEARALAGIEKQEFRSKGQPVKTVVANEAFYRKIKQWRSDKAKETGADESQILRQNVMIEISGKLPATIAQLKAVKGMGGKKMKLFGPDLLALIMEYRKQQGMEIPTNAAKEIQMAGYTTKDVSLELFRQGLKPEEVAKRRRLALSTIESHLAHFVGTGKVDIFEVIDRKKYDVIITQLEKKHPEETINDIRQKLGDHYSYSEIRLVMAELAKNTSQLSS